MYLRQSNECPLEIHLRRLTVDEALFRLERYLNDAYLAGMSTVRVIHGKGTGTLRQAVRDELKNHPLVKSFRRATIDEGGEGATIVELADE
ncbi:MAG: Smr/MutS family protein [Chloroflexota bacterium]|nr:Smr/MutS family protein [Chloroflexota bacterium]